jgi:HAD superfamily hydrolase (TIGR01549 family)
MFRERILYMAGTIETLFLDAGGVLVVPNWVRVAGALERHGVHVGAPSLAAAEPHAKRRLDIGDTIHTTTDNERGGLYFNLILEEAGVPPTPATDAALAEVYEYHARENLWELVPDGVPQALAALRSRGLKLVVVSNANGRLRHMFARLGLAERVDVLFDSFEEGVEKPDPRLFQIALERSGARPETTLHVGDLYYVDIVGARAAGLRAVLLDAAGLYEGYDCPRIGSLGALVDLLAAGFSAM